MAKSSGYRPIFSASAVAFFLTLSRRRQRKLLDRAHELAADPVLIPDYRSRDADDRDISHLLVDGFIFDYWVDDAVRQVIITEIESAE